MTVPSGSTTPVEAAAPAVPAPPAPGAPATPPPPPASADPVAPAAPAAGAPAPTRSLEDSLGPLDEDTRKFVLDELSKVRREAAGLRGAKTQAANEAKNEMAQLIGKAIGLVPDQVDPATLADQLTTATGVAQQAQAELAVYKAASGKANVAALLDSRTFAQQLAGINPADGAAIDALVTAAVTANPTMFGLAEPDARRLPFPNPAQGGGFNGDGPTLDDQYAAAVMAGDTKEQIRIQNQKLAALTAR